MFGFGESLHRFKTILKSASWLHHSNFHKTAWRWTKFCTKLFPLYNIFIICNSNGGICRLNAWRICIMTMAAHTCLLLLCRHYLGTGGWQQPTACVLKVLSFHYTTYIHSHHANCDGGSSKPSIIQPDRCSLSRTYIDKYSVTTM